VRADSEPDGAWRRKTREMIEWLDDHPSMRDPEPFAGPDHPMRLLTRSIALGEPWTPADVDRVSSIFDALAGGWTADHVDATKAAPVRDALDRGDVPLDGDWLELGAGTGAGARILAGTVKSLIATDLSTEMLHNAPADLAPRVQADAAVLPFADDSFDAVLMINMLLFPTEVDRVVRADGVVVWVNTLGDQTPIHLPASDVLDSLPGNWHGRTARAGTGFWLTARRD
jgi:SAM-dependent methyltransferase